MEKTENYQEESSEEVREIMGQQANWMVRWGAVLLALIVAVIISVFTIITYPVFVTVPFQVEAVSSEPIASDIFGEAMVSDVLYHQIEIGQEVQVAVSDTLKQHIGRVITGRVTDKRPGGQVQLLFPVEVSQLSIFRNALQQTGEAKIKTDEKRLISQFSGLFLPK